MAKEHITIKRDGLQWNISTMNQKSCMYFIIWSTVIVNFEFNISSSEKVICISGNTESNRFLSNYNSTMSAGLHIEQYRTLENCEVVLKKK